MRVATYNPHANGGEPQVFRVVNRATQWRVVARFQTNADATPVEITMRIADRMRLSEAHMTFLDEMAHHIPDGALVTSAQVDFWADV